MILRITLIAISWLLLAAHFSRADLNIIAVLCLLLPFILLVKNKWAHKILVILTTLGALEWIRTAWKLINTRIENGEDWRRMALILFAVALFTMVSGMMLNSKKIRDRYRT